MDGLGKGIFDIAMALLGIALLALLVGNASKTTAIISQAGDTFNTLIRTVTLQSSMGINGGSNSSSIY